MNKFLTYTGILLVVTIAMMIFGDIGYTYIYNNGSYRNKVMWVRDSTALESHYDYVVLGSSRAYYHVDPILIEEKTNKNGLNLAINNSFPFEIKLMLLEFLKNASADKVFVQVDYTYNVTQPDMQASVDWMPYLKEDDLFKEFPKGNTEYKAYKSFPFYRYEAFESELGFRNVALSLLGKQPKFLQRKGFVSLQNRVLDVEPFTFTLEDNLNPHIQDIISLCEEHNIEVHFFTAPFFNSSGNLEILQKHLPNYTNFSEAIEGEEFFSDAIHLNENGAIRFTSIFSETYFE